MDPMTSVHKQVAVVVAITTLADICFAGRLRWGHEFCSDERYRLGVCARHREESEWRRTADPTCRGTPGSPRAA